MKIVSIVPSKHVKDRFILTMEDESVIKVTIDQIADYSLFSGRDLDGDEYERVLRDASVSNIRARALRIMGSRTMSRKQIIDKLIEKGEPAGLADETADWLESIGVLNDAEYADMIVSHYSERGYGTEKIKDEFYRRGIPRELWDDAIGKMPDNSDALYEFIEQKLGGVIPDRALADKVSRAALRRGFRWEDVRSALSRYGSEYEE